MALSALQLPGSVHNAMKKDQHEAIEASKNIPGDSGKIKRTKDNMTVTPAINRTVSANHPRHPKQPSYRN